ncbi:hypothetical protein C1646_748338 [Rhizophagus diaphanus]|nr:hypothetical protein C1646_748338 [Rhizophagus diaphanus] [Rhizophagus sp. MUCL 43196]
MSSITEDIFSKIHREKEKALALRQKLVCATPCSAVWGRRAPRHEYRVSSLRRAHLTMCFFESGGGHLRNDLLVNYSKKLKINRNNQNSTNGRMRNHLTANSVLQKLRTKNELIDQILANFETKSHLERYNIVCLFDIEFTYTKKLLTVLSIKQIQELKNEWIEAEKYLRQEKIEDSWNKCTLKKQVDDYLKILDEKMDRNTFFIDFNELYTAFMMQPSNEYQHQSNYELFWCQDLYKRMTLQFLRNRSVLKDKTASEFRYRDELVNHLLSTIFYDVEDAIWIDTTRKRQRNFSKAENEREQLGDKHDGVIYMNVHGSKVEVGFFEVVAMMISLRYQHAYSKDTSNL